MNEVHIPTMPEGYVLLEESGYWYILKDEGVFMKRLLDSRGNALRFEHTTIDLAKAVDYAQKHKDAGLSYASAVPESPE